MPTGMPTAATNQALKGNGFSSLKMWTRYCAKGPKVLSKAILSIWESRDPSLSRTTLPLVSEIWSMDLRPDFMAATANISSSIRNRPTMMMMNSARCALIVPMMSF